MSATMAKSYDERLLAGLAHISILLDLFTGLGGVLVSGVLYLWAREHSDYVAEQAMQSLYHQLRLLGLSIGGGLLASVLTAGVAAWCVTPLLAAMWMSGISSAVRAGKACLCGKDFRYRWFR
jgi:uncharacterized Tic20 family protein